jgi:hypothetical protein
MTPNSTAYAKQQPPLRPRATEEMADMAAGGGKRVGGGARGGG